MQLHIDRIVGIRLGELRRASRWTQTKLRERLTELGIRRSEDFVSQIETGRKKHPSPADIGALALALDVPPLALLLPSEHDTAVEVTPNVVLEGPVYRRWMSGHITALLSLVEEAPSEFTWWTADNQPVDDDDHQRLREVGRVSLLTDAQERALATFPTARRLIAYSNSLLETLPRVLNHEEPSAHEFDIDEELKMVADDVQRLREEIRRFRARSARARTQLNGQEDGGRS